MENVRQNTRSDERISNPAQKFFEVIPAIGPFEPRVIHREAFDQVIAEPFGRPQTELRSPVRADAISNGQNCIEAVMINFSRNLPSTFDLNYSEIPNSCRTIEFLFVINTLQMLVDAKCVTKNILTFGLSM
jgi:hypothetical protein